MRLTVPYQGILWHSRFLCNVAPAKSSLAEFQHVVGIHFDGWPTEPHPASPSCFLPSYDALADCAPFQFCNRRKNCEDHFSSRRAGVNTLLQAYEVNT